MHSLEKKEKDKSRNQSRYEYFEILQLEWITADLRAKIYPKLKDKNFWKRVKDGKKETIQDIASRNQLPTIFDDDQLLYDLRMRVYRLKSYPNFIYKNETNRQTQEYYDLMYYFNRGAEVRFEYFGEVKIGNVSSYTPLGRTVFIEFDGKNEELPVSEVTRIL